VAGPKSEFDRVVSEAVDDLAETGFTSAERVAYWEERIRRAAEEDLRGPSKRMDDVLRDVLRRAYEKAIEGASLTKLHPGIGRFTVERLRPELRSELDRRILASANLIRLRRKQRIEQTLSRFSGWATSQPKGGSAEPEKRETKERIRGPIASASFEERRVLVDQGHKLFSSVNELVATGGGAIAGVWHSRWRQPGYDYRPDHKERDLGVFLLRGSWALEQGLVKKTGEVRWIDDVTRPGEEPFCRCSYQYVYALPAFARLAPEAVTKKGEDWLKAAKAKVAALG
jgi:hypothetical protein